MKATMNKKGWGAANGGGSKPSMSCDGETKGTFTPGKSEGGLKDRGMTTKGWGAAKPGKK